MSDTFVKWFLRVWLTAGGVSVLGWVWRHFPYALVFFAVGGLLVVSELRREQRRRQGQGWWLEYLSPGRLRAGEDDFAVVYHEGEKQHPFLGKENRRSAWRVLTVPSQVRWHEQVPDWMSGRRSEIVERIEQEATRRQRAWRFQIVEERGE